MQTALQELLMNAQYNPEAMDNIRRMMEKRLSEKRAANYMGMGAAGSYGQMSLEEMIAKASGQKPPGTMETLIGGNTQDIGGHGFLQSIWDAARF